MNSQKQSDLEALMQRFDAGDRSEELLEQLNRAAFECFHAPWESYQDPRLLQADGLPSTTQGLLPMEDEESEVDNDMEDLKIPQILRSKPNQPFQSRLQPLSNAEDSSIPLERLSAALNSMGRMAHYAPGRGLMVDLDHDPRSDNQSLLSFRPDWEGKRLLMISRGDLPLQGLSELDLERICRAYNRRSTGIEAKTYRPRVGARLRLHLYTTIPFDLTGSFQALVDHLAHLVQEDRKFWRQVRQHRPT